MVVVLVVVLSPTHARVTITQGPIFHPTEPCIFVLSAGCIFPEWTDAKESKKDGGKRNNATTRAAREAVDLRGMRLNDDPGGLRNREERIERGNGD